MKKNISALFYFLFFFASFSMMGQNGYWTEIDNEISSKKETIIRSVYPENYQIYQLDLVQFKKLVQNVPLQGSIARKSNVIISFPMPEGKLERFSVTESPIMEPGLAEKFPMIKTYKAIGIDDPTASMRFSMTQYGLHSMMLSGKRSSVFIDPYTTDASTYMVYNKASLEPDSNEFVCYTEQDAELPSLENKVASPLNDTDDQTLRTYRLALSCTAEYGNYFATNPGTELADIQAAMVIAINRVNEVYERDMAISLVFVANNDQIIYFGDTSADPWTFGWNSTTQTEIDNTIGSANYDIGHNFNLSGGGNAGCIGCVCINGQKGSGYTGRPNPTGDPFYIDYVAHEMGHQFGGLHTMNYCNRSGDGTTEVEPGSGSSIMGYAGICAPNVQPHSDAHFNYVSIRDISANIQPGGDSTCAVETALTNQPPVADAGLDYTIPKSTAFVLTGSATDPDGLASLTYNWSQNDPEMAPNNGTPDPTWTVGPLYRSILPTASPARYLPQLSEVLNGNLTPMWEVTPSAARTMNFAFLVRDNGSGFPLGIGQTDADLMEVTVAGTAGPFVVTSQNTAVTWNEGDNEIVTWDVANTDVAPVNAANVNILLSTDGGLTFATTLASNVPNDGSEQITVPSVGSLSARIMIQAVNNIFYAVNATEFSIQESVEMNFSDTEVSVCQPDDAIFDFVYNTFNGFSETTTFSATNLPSGTSVSFNPITATADGTAVQMTISGTASVAIGSYTITVTGTSATKTKTADLTLNVYNSSISAMALSSPVDASTGIGLLPNFTWDENPNAETYEFEIATDVAFTSMVESASTLTNSNTLTTSLNQATTYYWRVRAVNDCGTGNYSPVFSFVTLICSNCASAGNTDYDTSITWVEFNTITNTSGKPFGYNDYTTISTTVEREMSYGLTVNVNTGGNFPSKIMVWIDWNQNCSFDDAGESYVLGDAMNVSNGATSNSPLSITVPANAYLGNTIMRVSTKYDSAATSCEATFDGEVEDYTIMVETLGVTENSFDSFAVWPNPNHGEFSIQLLSTSNQDIHVNVYDIRGRRVYQKAFKNIGQFDQQIKVENLQSGIYLLRVNDGKSNVVKKLIVK